MNLNCQGSVRYFTCYFSQSIRRSSSLLFYVSLVRKLRKLNFKFTKFNTIAWSFDLQELYRQFPFLTFTYVDRSIVFLF